MHQLLPLPLLQHPLADLEDKSLSTVTTTTSTTTTHAPILTSFKTGTSAQSLSILNQASQGFPPILPIHPIHPTPPTPHTPHPIPQLVSEDLLPLHHLLHLLVPESLTEFSAPEDSDLEEVPCLVAALALSAIVVGMITLITPKPLAVVTITDVRFFFYRNLIKKNCIFRINFLIYFSSLYIKSDLSMNSHSHKVITRTLLDYMLS